MAKTSAERQAALRARRSGERMRQLNAWVSEEAYLALKQLAERHYVSKGDVLGIMLTNKEELDKISDKISEYVHA